MLILASKELAAFCNMQRKHKKLSQFQTASKVGLKQTTVSKFEIRPESTKLDTLFRILSALDLEMHITPKPKGKPVDSQWTEEW